MEAINGVKHAKVTNLTSYPGRYRFPLLRQKLQVAWMQKNNGVKHGKVTNLTSYPGRYRFTFLHVAWMQTINGV